MDQVAPTSDAVEIDFMEDATFPSTNVGSSPDLQGEHPYLDKHSTFGFSGPGTIDEEVNQPRPSAIGFPTPFDLTECETLSQAFRDEGHLGEWGTPSQPDARFTL